ncbi:MAG: hypothetical protein NC218_06790 [Acetobacter sp.]|nr:hypothetical protein [Acetobacter sp.]
MEKQCLIGVILAGCGIALVWGQLLLTMVINCRILQDLAQNKKPRYPYVTDYLKGITDMSVFLRFVDDRADYRLTEVVYREPFKCERRLSISGKILEFIGGMVLCFYFFNLDGKSPAFQVLVCGTGVWVLEYAVNLVFEFFIAQIASYQYWRCLR